MMNEKSLRKGFEEIAYTLGYNTERYYNDLSHYSSFETERAFHLWLKSARRADREAREECAEICEHVWSGPHAEYRDGAQVCEELIRETMTEDK